MTAKAAPPPPAVRNGIRLSLGGTIQATTLVAALMAAGTGISSYTRLRAEMDLSKEAIVAHTAQIDKLGDLIGKQALIVAEFTSASTMDRANIHRQLEDVTQQLRSGAWKQP